MKPIILPEQDYLNSLLYYDKEQGTLHWLPQQGKRCNNTKTRAGSFATRGYRIIRIDGRLYQEHRIIWVMHNGLISSNLDIDHIDRNPSNNKLENLRLATRSLNNINKNSKGVCYDKARNKWRAQLTINGKCILNKRFNSYEEALVNYKEVKDKTIENIKII
jgi:hypothetical protein